MAYRLYNEDVAQGITDFNDDKYHVLQECGGYAIILNDHIAEFIVVTGLKYHEYNSIDWNQGHYFENIIAATDYFTREVMNVRRFFRMDPAPSNETLQAVLNTMIEARDEGNIPDTDLEGMFDLTIAFMRENPELFDEEVIADIEDTLA